MGKIHPQKYCWSRPDTSYLKDTMDSVWYFLIIASESRSASADGVGSKKKLSPYEDSA